MSALAIVVSVVGYLLMTTVMYVAVEAVDYRKHVREGKNPEEYAIEPEYWWLSLLWPVFLPLYFGEHTLKFVVRKVARVERLPEYRTQRLEELEQAIMKDDGA